MRPSQLINFILKICCFPNNSAVFCDFKNIVFLEMLDKKTDLNFVKYQKKKGFFWPVKVGSNLKENDLCVSLL